MSQTQVQTARAFGSADADVVTRMREGIGEAAARAAGQTLAQMFDSHPVFRRRRPSKTVIEFLMAMTVNVKDPSDRARLAHALVPYTLERR